MESSGLPNILDLTADDLRAELARAGEPAFRAGQVWQWLWQKGARDFAAMTNLSKTLRTKLGERFEVRLPEVDAVAGSRDGTIKFLLRLRDGALVETVLIPERTHYTQCLSTQVGCAMACSFCSTGGLGFSRNMSHGEILGQVLVARSHLEREGLDKPLRNLVFMGMGEPLLNFETLVAGLGSLASDTGLGFSRRRMTVSTVGVPGKLLDFGRRDLARLAVSLHAPTQEIRERIMPRAAKAYPLERLMADLRAYPLRSRERLTFEYILLRGLNDEPAHARELVRLLSHLRCKVNLIPCNPGPDSPHEEPEPERVAAFQDVLRSRHLIVLLRRSMGRDIDAACGQLAARAGGELG